MANFNLQAVPLTRENFQAFGDVIEIDGASHFSINEGSIERFHDLATVSIDAEHGGRPLISIAKSNEATQVPAQVKLVERHLRGSQAFIPMFESPLIVVVSCSGESVEPGELKAFVTNGKQGFNYHPGTWHMPLITPQVGQQLLVVDRGGPGDNCEELYFENDEIIVFI